MVWPPGVNCDALLTTAYHTDGEREGIGGSEFGHPTSHHKTGARATHPPSPTAATTLTVCWPELRYTSGPRLSEVKMATGLIGTEARRGEARLPAGLLTYLLTYFPADDGE